MNRGGFIGFFIALSMIARARHFQAQKNQTLLAAAPEPGYYTGIARFYGIKAVE